ncbi:MAG: hypothetical protein ACFB4I_08805 [Cyanophyceae cyanobacterium]
MAYSGERQRKIAEHLRLTADNDNVNPDKRVDEREKRKNKVMDHLDKSKGK